MTPKIVQKGGQKSTKKGVENRQKRGPKTAIFDPQNPPSGPPPENVSLDLPLGATPNRFLAAPAGKKGPFWGVF